MNTLHYPYTSLNLLDPDGSLQQELAIVKKATLTTQDTLNQIAESEFFKFNDENRKVSEKKSYDNKQYGEEIFLYAMLEEIDMYLAYCDFVIDQQQRARDQEMNPKENVTQAIEESIKAMYQSYHKKQTLNQTPEMIVQKIMERIVALEKAIADLTKKMDRDWGANTWEAGLQQLVEKLKKSLENADFFSGAFTVEELADQKSIIDQAKQNIIEALSHRPDPLELHKRVTHSHAMFTQQLNTAKPEPQTVPTIPAPPTLDKVYAPSRKQVFTQYEIDTEVTICSNICMVLKNVFQQKKKSPPKAIIRMGAEKTKDIMDKEIRPTYLQKINEHTTDAILKENLQHLKQRTLQIVDIVHARPQSVVNKKP